LLPFARPKKTELWAVRGLTAHIDRGETVGIVGRNGAGKTTLLRLLAGVSLPTEGSLTVRGRIAPLISVGVGFHQEMSGRENIYVNGMLLGLTRGQIRDRFEEIVDFAELADFIDTPVKFYSSGMFMRLGFSVAAHVDPEVLLVDEVLAVGDIAFQLKCLDRMRHLQEHGTTIVLVSHSMQAIRLLCPRALVIRNGGLEFDGDTETAISLHHELLSADAAEYEASSPLVHTDEPRGVRILERQLVGPDGPTHHPHQDDVVTYRVKLRFDEAVESPQLFFHVISETGIPAYGMATAVGDPWRSFSAGEVTEALMTFRPRLGGGTYRLVVIVTDQTGRRELGNDRTGMLMFIASRTGTMGVADLEASITIDDHVLTDHRDRLLSSPNSSSAVEADNDSAESTIESVPPRTR
jgi:lipopolysaccharide transport system ATP-binding protein